MKEKDWKRRVENVRRIAKERGWISILLQLAPDLRSALDKPGRHVPCPVHGGTDGFRLFKDVDQTGGGICNTCGAKADGFALLMWYNNDSFMSVFKDVESVLNLTDQPISPPKPRFQPEPIVEPVIDQAAEDELRQKLRVAWSNAAPVAGKKGASARKYLLNRGVPENMLDWDSLKALRFHPWLPFGKTYHHSAMVAMVHDADGKPVTLHRTYITRDGAKAPFKKVKLLHPYPTQDQLSGGAIHLLDPYAGFLGLAEGIETSLAVLAANGLPVWATVSAGMMSMIRLPKEVDKVIIWADNDAKLAGQKAAHKAAKRFRLEGRQVIVKVPQGRPEGAKSIDWLDILNRDGVAGIPSREDLLGCFNTQSMRIAS